MSPSIWQLLIVVLIVLLLFGTKKLRNIGGDLGEALKGFKKAMSDDSTSEKKNANEIDADFKNEALNQKNTNTAEITKDNSKEKD